MQALSIAVEAKLGTCVVWGLSTIRIVSSNSCRNKALQSFFCIFLIKKRALKISGPTIQRTEHIQKYFKRSRKTASHRPPNSESPYFCSQERNDHHTVSPVRQAVGSPWIGVPGDRSPCDSNPGIILPGIHSRPAFIHRFYMAVHKNVSYLNCV